MRVVNPPARPPMPATAWPAFQFEIVLPIIARTLRDGGGYWLAGSHGGVTYIAKLAPDGTETATLGPESAAPQRITDRAAPDAPLP